MKSIVLFLFILSTILLSKPLDITKPSKTILENELVQKLQNGGHIVYYRHSFTNKNQTDIKEDFNDCSTQRNLSAKGIETARKIGETLDKLKINISQVITSPYCRCVDTAKYLSTPYMVDHGLRFSLIKDRKETIQLTKHLQTLFTTISPKSNENIFIVAHTSNLREAVGLWPKPEAVMMIFKRENGVLHFLGKIDPDHWDKY